MLQKLKQQSINKMIIRACIFLAIAVAVFFFTSAHNVFMMIKGPTDMDTLSTESLEGQYVRAKVYVIYDYYAEITKDGKATAREYIIPIGEDEYIGLSLPKSKFGAAEAVMDSTAAVLNNSADSLNGATVTVTGTIHAMDSDSQYYYTDYLTESGLNEEQQQLFLPLILDSGKVGASSTYDIFFFLFVCGAFLAIGFIPLILAFTGYYQKQIVKMCSLQPFPQETEAALDTFYSTVEPLYHVRANSDFVMYDSASESWVIPAKSVVWFYQTTTQHRTNGIPTGKSYSVTVHSREAGASATHSISLNKEANGAEVLRHLHLVLPNAVCGYSEALKSLYDQNPDTFLSTYHAIQAENNADTQAG